MADASAQNQSFEEELLEEINNNTKQEDKQEPMENVQTNNDEDSTKDEHSIKIDRHTSTDEVPPSPDDVARCLQSASLSQLESELSTRLRIKTAPFLLFKQAMQDGGQCIQLHAINCKSRVCQPSCEYRQSPITTTNADSMILDQSLESPLKRLRMSADTPTTPPKKEPAVTTTPSPFKHSFIPQWSSVVSRAPNKIVVSGQKRHSPLTTPAQRTLLQAKEEGSWFSQHTPQHIKDLIENTKTNSIQRRNLLKAYEVCQARQGEEYGTRMLENLIKEHPASYEDNEYARFCAFHSLYSLRHSLAACTRHMLYSVRLQYCAIQDLCEHCFGRHHGQPCAPSQGGCHSCQDPSHTPSSCRPRAKILGLLDI